MSVLRLAALGGACALAALPAVAEVAQTARASAVKSGYVLFDEPRSRFSCELPETWRREHFPAEGSPRMGRVALIATSQNGRAKITVKQYNGRHPDWPSPEGFVKKEAGSALVNSIVIGRRRSRGQYFERRSGERREVFAVLAQARKPRFYVFQYSADAKAYPQYLGAFQHVLRTLLMKPTTKPLAKRQR